MFDEQSYARRWYQRNKEHVKARVKEWQENNTDKVKETKRNWRARNKAQIRQHVLVTSYGITQRIWDQEYRRLKGLCGLKCGRPIGKVTDHIPGTKIFRSLLCRSCNVALGLFLDDPKLMRRAARYVKYHAQKNKDR